MTEKQIDRLPAGQELDDLLARAFSLPHRPYSADMASAWDLVLALDGRGLRLMLDKRTADGPFVPKWHAAFTEESSDGYYTADAPAAPLAICRAALKSTLTNAKTLATA